MKVVAHRPEALDALHHLAARSFLAYYEVASPADPVDDGDRALDALIKELAAKERHYVERTSALLEGASMSASAGPFALQTSYYNFVRSRTIAERLVREFDREIGALRALEASLPTDESPEGAARKLAADFIALRTEGRRRVAELLEKTKPPAPPPPPPPAAKPAAAPAPAASAPAAPKPAASPAPAPAPSPPAPPSPPVA
jgi:hypothetical protein